MTRSGIYFFFFNNTFVPLFRSTAGPRTRSSCCRGFGCDVLAASSYVDRSVCGVGGQGCGAADCSCSKLLDVDVSSRPVGLGAVLCMGYGVRCLM